MLSAQPAGFLLLSFMWRSRKAILLHSNRLVSVAVNVAWYHRLRYLFSGRIFHFYDLPARLRGRLILESCSFASMYTLYTPSYT
jgi:hypothetical protein